MKDNQHVILFVAEIIEMLNEKYKLNEITTADYAFAYRMFTLNFQLECISQISNESIDTLITQIVTKSLEETIITVPLRRRPGFFAKWKDTLFVEGICWGVFFAAIIAYVATLTSQ